MTAIMKKVIHDGCTYYSIADAARYLHTSTKKVREMIGDGSLVCKQLRTNGKLYVTAKSLVEKQKAITVKKS